MPPMDTTTNIAVRYLELLAFAKSNGVATEEQIKIGKTLWTILIGREQKTYKHLCP